MQKNAHNKGAKSSAPAKNRHKAAVKGSKPKSGNGYPKRNGASSYDQPRKPRAKRGAGEHPAAHQGERFSGTGRYEERGHGRDWDARGNDDRRQSGRGDRSNRTRSESAPEYRKRDRNDWYPQERSGGSRDNRYGKPERRDESRGRYDRNDRPQRDERYGRGGRPAGDDRYSRDNRGSGGRPSRDDRQSGGYRDSGRADDRRPDVRDDRGAKADRRPSDRGYSSDRGTRRDNVFAPNRDRGGRGSERKPYRGQAQANHVRGQNHTKTPSWQPTEDIVHEKIEATVVDPSSLPDSFYALGVDNRVVQKLADMGASTPFPIQAATIPDAMAGRNVLGRGRTGSGKTIAFGAPLVTRLLSMKQKKGAGRAPRALILAPTRELANQIDKTVQPLARAAGLFTTTVYGGVAQYKQVNALRKGVDIVIACPGRLEDLQEQGHLNLDQVMITVIDEADHMCELGFVEPVRRILGSLNPEGQKMLFSATLDNEVAALVKDFLPDHVAYEAPNEDQESGTIEHTVLLVEQREKRAIIEELAGLSDKTVIFTRTRAYAEQLADDLDDAGIRAVSLHGDLNQARRSRNLAKLTEGKVNVLVATDVAARGIHVDDVTLVIQADAPDEFKAYLHRAGRTGRAGKHGQVVTLIPRGRRRRMNELLSRAQIKAPMIEAQPGAPILEELARS